LVNKYSSLSEQEKQNIAVLSASGLTIHAIAVRMQRSDKVIKKYLYSFPVQQQVQDIRERLIVKYQRLAEECVDKLLAPGTIDKASPRDLATISGISVDKARLLSEQSTANLSVRSEALNSIKIDEKAMARIMEVIHRMDASDKDQEGNVSLQTQTTPALGHHTGR
jgi:Tc3 transposase